MKSCDSLVQAQTRVALVNMGKPYQMMTVLMAILLDQATLLIIVYTTASAANITN
jgi:hypothetical protein